ncbi:MAG: hypothetical protein ACJAZ8_002269 [Planctomycetota bacterium]|jgi:hypothetical protein
MESDDTTPRLLLAEDLKTQSPTLVGETAWEVVDQYVDAVSEPLELDGSVVSLLPKPWRAVYVLQCLDMQVNNGGFHQFFTNGHGTYDPHLREDIESLDQSEYKAILLAAWEKYEQMDYREQWGNLGISWDRFTEGYKQFDFEAEDTAYYALTPDLPTVLGQSILEHFDQYCSQEDSNPLNAKAKPPRVPLEHSLFRRLQWNPFLVAIPLQYMWYSTFLRGFPLPRTLGACFMLLWFVMSVRDFKSGHKLLDWMYGPDDVDK